MIHQNPASCFELFRNDSCVQGTYNPGSANKPGKGPKSKPELHPRKPKIFVLLTMLSVQTSQKQAGYLGVSPKPGAKPQSLAVSLPLRPLPSRRGARGRRAARRAWVWGLGLRI